MSATAPESASALAHPGVCVSVAPLRALRRLAQARVGLRRDAETLTPGAVVSRRRGRGLEAVDIRPFVHGDDPRHIDRNVTARTGRPHVRSFHDERALATLLVADFRPPMLWGTRTRFCSVAAAMALALIGWRAAAAGGRVGLLAAHGDQTTLAPLRPLERGMEAAIGALVAAHDAGLRAGAGAAAAPLAPALRDALALAPRGGDVALATSFEAPGDAAQRAEALALIAALARRARLRVLLVRDAFETAPPPGLYPMATAGGPAFWARIRRGAAPPPDPRPALLRQLGAQVTLIDADATPEQMLAAMEAPDGRR